MSISDYIQLGIGIVAGIGAIFSFLNIMTMNKQVNLQQKQWEFTHQPIYLISYISELDNKAVTLVLKNTNNVSHQIENISFSSTDVQITTNFNGYIQTKETRRGEITEQREFHGLLVTLSPKDSSYQNGILQIRGIDSLGNEFKLNTNPLIFNNFDLENHLDVSMTYLKNI